MIKGLSYSDWEDEADQLRQVATGLGAVGKKHLTRAQKLLSNLQDELDAIDGVSSTLTGFDAIRVGCVRDLLVALKISLEETRRLLNQRGPKPKARRARAATH